ncbi:MAG: HEAT repeat domain-containing protein, partial [Myxococcota bacterium]|nr:HEAT repeat domain-containing protein [Myxococcota bacterium]
MEVAARLLRSSDPDDRLRGVDRAAHMHSLEAFALLERAAAPGSATVLDPHTPLDGLARTDPRALLTVVRGLSSWTETDRARASLSSIVGAPVPSFATHATLRADGPDDGQGAARIQLAREEAAIALARSGNGLALETLIALSRSGGPGQAAALGALTLYPPEAPVLGGVTLTTPAMAVLAASVGDLRSFDALEGATRTSDPALRASALVALGQGGDARAARTARDAANDPDARVRLAAGEALVLLGAPDAAEIVSRLIADDTTALGGLRLAQRTQGESVIKAAAAVAVASANPERRAAAVAALGRQVATPAVAALVEIIADPLLEGDAACALGRSPSRAAMRALETMSGEHPRLAGRAYLVRRLVLGQRSVRLDELLRKLADAESAIDRGVGLEALVATGERAVAVALTDSDARVRRVAAMGALARWDAQARDALLDRMAVERDPATRQVLALGLLEGDAEARVPSDDLGARAHGGGPDAPLAGLSLARRVRDD